MEFELGLILNHERLCLGNRELYPSNSGFASTPALPARKVLRNRSLERAALDQWDTAVSPPTAENDPHQRNTSVTVREQLREGCPKASDDQS